MRRETRLYRERTMF